MRILLVYNVSDRRCGFRNYGDQTAVALRRAGHEVVIYDGTYPAVYLRQQDLSRSYTGFFPPDANTYDVVHVIWHALRLNHYAGAPWAELTHPLLSWIDGGPSDAVCPFKPQMQVRWGHYPTPEREAEGYYLTPLPIPDWVTDLPEPDPVFTVGATSVRGDGVGHVRAVCERHYWAMNLPQPDQWLTLDEEVRRLARSTVNVCWYSTNAIWQDRAGAPSTALASRRPLLVSDDRLLAHLAGYPDLYHGWLPEHGEPGLEESLLTIESDWRDQMLVMPQQVLKDFSWASAAEEFTRVWEMETLRREGQHG